MGYRDQIPFSTLEGITMTSVTGAVGDDEMIFTAEDGRRFRLYHEQDCCDSVSVDDIVGDLNDLVGTPILKADEATSEDNPPAGPYGPPESFTWTFYKLATVKGYVDIKWLGESNGYYSESVYFVECSPVNAN